MHKKTHIHRVIIKGYAMKLIYEYDLHVYLILNFSFKNTFFWFFITHTRHKIRWYIAIKEKPEFKPKKNSLPSMRV